MLTRNKNRRENSLLYADKSVTPEKCRICLKEGEIPIFGEKDLSESVMEFGGIEIDQEDDLPQHICSSCHALLTSAMLFRKIAKESDDILKNTDYLEDGASILSEDYSADGIYDTDSESFIKREYLEYKDTSDSENENNSQIYNEFNNENDVNDTQSEADAQETNDDKEFQMQLLKMENEDYDDAGADNELVMIIVSDKEKEGTFKCLKCNITFENRSELDQHDTENHPNISAQHKRCDICYESVLKSSYKVHIKQHRENYKAKHDKKYGKVECEVCGKKLNKSYYKYHMKIHGSAEEQAGRLVQCTICNKSFSANYFNDHLKRVHDKVNKRKTPQEKKEKDPQKTQTLLKCPICDKNIKQSNYKEHLIKHGGSRRRYICDQCGKVFKHPSAFKTHTLTHGSELKYQCQFCPYRGLHQGLLKIHVRTHTGDYNYKCTECPARFITKSNLSKHIQRHKGIFKFKCDTCNKGFYSKRDVDKHVKTVHLELKNSVCDICGKGFGHRDSMLSHQLKIHKREKITDRKGRMPSYLKEEMKNKN